MVDISFHLCLFRPPIQGYKCLLIQHPMKPVLLLFALFLLGQLKAQTRFYYNGVTDLHVLSSWGTDTSGSGNQPASFNVSADTFEIRNTPHTGLKSTWTVNARVVLGDGIHPIQFVIPDSAACNTSLTCKPFSTLIIKNLNVPVLDSCFDSTTIRYAGIGMQSLSDRTYFSLMVDSGSVAMATGDCVVRNALTVNGILDFNALGEKLAGTFPEVYGDGKIRTLASGSNPLPMGINWHCTVEFYRPSGTQVIPFGTYASIIVSGGSSARNVSGGDLVVHELLYLMPGTNLAMNAFQLTGTLDSLGGSGTITTQCTSSTPLPENKTWPFQISYVANGNQTVRTGTYLSNLAIGTGGIKTADGPIAAYGNLSVTSSTFNLGIWPLLGNLTGISGLTGIIQTANTSTSPIPEGLTWTQTVLYNGNENQQIASGHYHHLTITGTAKSCFANGPISVSGNFVLNNEDTLNMLTHTLAVENITSGNGSIYTACVTGNAVSPGKSWIGINMHYNATSWQTVVSGRYEYLDLTGGPRLLSNMDTIKISSGLKAGTDSLIATGNVMELNGNGAQLIQPGGKTYFDQFLITGSGNKTVSGDNLSVNGKLLIAGNANLILGNQLLNGDSLTPEGAGILTTTSNAMNPIPYGKTWPFAVAFTGSSVGQTIVSGTYRSLSITSGSDVNRANGPIVLMDSGTLQISSGNVLDMGSYSLEVGVQITNGGAGTIRTQNTGDFPITPARIWTQHVSYNGSDTQHVVSGFYKASLNINGGPRFLPEADTLAVAGNFTASSGLYVHTINSTMAFIGGGNQTIALFAHFPIYNLYCAGTGIKTFSNPVRILNTMRVSENAVCFLGAFPLAGDSLTTLSGSGTLRTVCTGVQPWPDNLTWRFRIHADGVNRSLPRGLYQGGIKLSGNGVQYLNGSIEVNDSLIMDTGTELDLGKHTLTLSGTFSSDGNGSLTGSDSAAIIISPSSMEPGMLRFTQRNDSTRTLHRLTVNRSNKTVSLGNMLRITGWLEIDQGVLNSNGNLVLASLNQKHAAQVAPVGEQAAITGAVTVERFVKGKDYKTNSRWRFVSSPVDADESIHESWQLQTPITGKGSGGNICGAACSNGFDVTQTRNPSFYEWNVALQQWDSIRSTYGDSLKCGIGYRLFYRGNRGQGCALIQGNPPQPRDTALRVKGKLKTGMVQLKCGDSSGHYALVGNPYQANIDWTSGSIDKKNLSPVIYTFRDDVASSGAYASYTTYPVPDSTNGMSRYIPPGSAFFVCTGDSGNGELTFSESCKSVYASAHSFFKNTETTIQPNTLRIRLAMNSGMVNDEAVLRILPGTQLHFSAREDVRKMKSGFDEISLQVFEKEPDVAICRIPHIPDTLIEVSLLLNTIRSERLIFEGISGFNSGVQLSLYQGATDKELKLTEDFSIPFDSIQGNPDFRLRIRFDKLMISDTISVHPSGLWCYPVPAKDVLNIRFNKSFISELKLFDANGHAVRSLSLFNPVSECLLNVSGLVPGTYWLRWSDEGNLQSLPIVIE